MSEDIKDTKTAYKQLNAAKKSSITFNKSQPHLKLKWATLYIQMALRPLTLRKWLDDRNRYDDFNKFFKRFLKKSVTEQIVTEASSSSGNSDPQSHQRRYSRRNSFSQSQLEECLKKQWDATEVAIDIFRQVLNGLNYIHLQNIVHHDIKPSNVFVGCENNGKLYVQLGDFGLACPLQAEHSPNGIMGTLAYAAPEQLNGQCNPKVSLVKLITTLRYQFQIGCAIARD